MGLSKPRLGGLREVSDSPIRQPSHPKDPINSPVTTMANWSYLVSSFAFPSADVKTITTLLASVSSSGKSEQKHKKMGRRERPRDSDVGVASK